MDGAGRHAPVGGRAGARTRAARVGPPGGAWRQVDTPWGGGGKRGATRSPERRAAPRRRFGIVPAAVPERRTLAPSLSRSPGLCSSGSPPTPPGASTHRSAGTPPAAFAP